MTENITQTEVEERDKPATRGEIFMLLDEISGLEHDINRVDHSVYKVNEKLSYPDKDVIFVAGIIMGIVVSLLAFLLTHVI